MDYGGLVYGRRLSRKTVLVALISLLTCLINTYTVTGISCYVCSQGVNTASLTIAVMDDITKGMWCFLPNPAQRAAGPADRNYCLYYWNPLDSKANSPDGNRLWRDYHPPTRFNYFGNPNLTSVPSTTRIQFCQIHIGSSAYAPDYMVCYCAYDNCNDITFSEMQQLWYNANKTLTTSNTNGFLELTINMTSSDPTELYGYPAFGPSGFRYQNGSVGLITQRPKTTLASTTDDLNLRSATGTDKPKESFTGLAVGVAVGVLAAALVVTGLVIWLVRRHNAGVRARRAARAKRVEQPPSLLNEHDVRL